MHSRWMCARTEVPARLLSRAIFDQYTAAPRWRKDEESGRIKSRRCMSTRNMSGNPVSIQHQRHTRLLSRGSLQGARPFEQAVGKLKRFERSALRCEKTAQNHGSFVAPALGIIFIKSVHTA